MRAGHKGNGRKKHPREMLFLYRGGVTPPLHSAGWAAQVGKGRSPPTEKEIGGTFAKGLAAEPMKAFMVFAPVALVPGSGKR